MTQIIGMEGTWPDRVAVAWGAAAVRSGDTVRNSFSGHTIAFDELANGRPTDIEAYVPLPKPVRVQPVHAPKDLVVVAIRRKHTNSYLFRTRKRTQPGEIGRVRDTNTDFYVFDSRGSFRDYARAIIRRIVVHVLGASEQLGQGVLVGDVEHLKLIREGLVLDARNPYLHALRVALTPATQEAAEGIARALMQSDPQRLRTFKHILKIFRGERVLYTVKYEDGIASGGGFDPDSAAKIFEALQRVLRNLRKARAQRGSTVADSPPRVLLAAGSAKLTFEVQLQAGPAQEPMRDPIVDRIGRYLEIRDLQRALLGDMPPALTGNASFREALDDLVNPRQATKVFHQPLDESEYVSVLVDPFVADGNLFSRPFSVFGVPQGFNHRHSPRVDITMSSYIREVVRIDDNGQGETPLGLHAFEQHDFMNRPFVFQFRRQMNQRKARYKYWLLSIQRLEQGKIYSIDSVPSSVVPGGFVMGPTHTLTVSEDEVHIDGAAVGPYGTNLGGWTRFFDNYMHWCRAAEIAALDDLSEWLVPPKVTPMTRVAELLLALESLGGDAEYETVVALVGKTHSARSLYRLHETGDLIAVHERDGDLWWSLTDAGERFLKVYHRATATTSSVAVTE